MSRGPGRWQRVLLDAPKRSDTISVLYGIGDFLGVRRRDQNWSQPAVLHGGWQRQGRHERSTDGVRTRSRRRISPRCAPSRCISAEFSMTPSPEPTTTTYPHSQHVQERSATGCHFASGLSGSSDVALASANPRSPNLAARCAREPSRRSEPGLIIGSATVRVRCPRPDRRRQRASSARYRPTIRPASAPCS